MLKGNLSSSQLGWWYSQGTYALCLVANPGLLPRVALASFYNHFPDLTKPKVRIGSKQRQNSLPDRSGNVFLVIIPLIFLQNKGPFQSLLCFDLSPCTPGSMKNPKEDGYEIMVSKVTNPVFFSRLYNFLTFLQIERRFTRAARTSV